MCVLGMEFRRLLATTGVLLLLSPAAAAFAETDPMKQCLEEQGGSTVGYAKCAGWYQQQMQDEQAAVLDRIRQLLSGQPPEGTNYKAATRALNRAQKQWLAYVKSDCAVVDATFGNGTAAGLAGASCISDHYATRNAVLKELETGLDPKARLDE